MQIALQTVHKGAPIPPTIMQNQFACVFIYSMATYFHQHAVHIHRSGPPALQIPRESRHSRRAVYSTQVSNAHHHMGSKCVQCICEIDGMHELGCI